MDGLTNTIGTELGLSTERKPPCERMFSLISKVSNLRRASLRATNELFSFIRLHSLEQMYLIYMSQEPDAVKQMVLQTDYRAWLSVAAKLDAQRNTSYTQTRESLMEVLKLEHETSVVGEGESTIVPSVDDEVSTPKARTAGKMYCTCLQLLLCLFL